MAHTCKQHLFGSLNNSCRSSVHFSPLCQILVRRSIPRIHFTSLYTLYTCLQLEDPVAGVILTEESKPDFPRRREYLGIFTARSSVSRGMMWMNSSGVSRNMEWYGYEPTLGLKVDPNKLPNPTPKMIIVAHLRLWLRFVFHPLRFPLHLRKVGENPAGSPSTVEETIRRTLWGFP